MMTLEEHPCVLLCSVFDRYPHYAKIRPGIDSSFSQCGVILKFASKKSTRLQFGIFLFRRICSYVLLCVNDLTPWIAFWQGWKESTFISKTFSKVKVSYMFLHNIMSASAEYILYPPAASDKQAVTVLGPRMLVLYPLKSQY